MKISRFTNIIKKDGIYLLHNTLVNSVVRINAESRQKFIDTIESGKSFSLDPNDNFHLTLLRTPGQNGTLTVGNPTP